MKLAKTERYRNYLERTSKIPNRVSFMAPTDEDWHPTWPRGYLLVSLAEYPTGDMRYVRVSGADDFSMVYEGSTVDVIERFTRVFRLGSLTESDLLEEGFRND
jgi:hypothetical protein